MKLSNNDGCVIARGGEVKALGTPVTAPPHLPGRTTRRLGVIDD
ncbi:hypothetical protein [Rhodoferax sp.]|nr:hypothetical protein [Rhodoferax sp.]MDP1945361.1 hypothetical protein [Rhodoferax sp.]MDP2441444.1 hypothetical protein [Rhodoferax sp.]MDZ4207306.1 hypothetical protein [Rhodoferax sp.]